VEEWFQSHGTLVYRRALVLLGNPAEAEDAVQEVFIKALDRFGTFRGEAKASTWLYRITTNHCLNQLRNQKRRRQLLDEPVSPDAVLVGAPSRAEIHALRVLLAEADDRQATCAIYIFVDGMSRPEAAEALGVSLRTVGNLLDRFVSWARARLDPDESLGFVERRHGAELPDAAPSGVLRTGTDR
jgi:RNA polymerase sigma-70 factor, ECF subfamily